MLVNVSPLNDGNAERPIAGIPFWQAQLNRGFHLTGIGGSDTHFPDEKSKPRSGVGYPETVVWAGKLSEHAVLQGIRSGRVFIDTEGTPDRLLEFSATSGGATVHMGDTLHVPSGATIHFTVHAVHVRGARIEIIQDGSPIAPFVESSIASEDARESFDLRGDGRQHWTRLNVRGVDGRLLLVANPVYW